MYIVYNMRLQRVLLYWQAGELDVLSAVIRWGEYHLVKRIEKRGEHHSTYAC